MRKHLGRIVLWSIPVILFIGLGPELSSRTSHTRTCRICAASYTHASRSILGIPVAWWDTQPRAGPSTRNYFDRYLGYPHEHQWTGGGYCRGGTRGTRCGWKGYGPYPHHQNQLTSMGLRLEAASGITDPAARRAYYESIILPADLRHFHRVQETCYLIESQKPPFSIIWAPEMEGIRIPDIIRRGELLPAP